MSQDITTGQFAPIFSGEGVYLHKQHCCRTNRSYVNKFTISKPLFENKQCSTAGKSEHFMLTVEKQCKNDCVEVAIGKLQDLINEILFNAEKDDLPNINVTFTLLSLHREFDLFNARLLSNLGEILTTLMSYSQFFNIRLVILNFAGYDNQTPLENPEAIGTIGRVLSVLSPASQLIELGQFDAVALNNPDSLRTFMSSNQNLRYLTGVLELADVITDKLAVKILRSRIEQHYQQYVNSHNKTYQK